MNARSRSSRRRSVRVELLCEGLARPALPLREGRATLLGEPALLRGEHRGGLGPLAGEHAADLLGVRGGLLRDGGAEGVAGLGDELRRRGGGGARPAQREPERGRDQERARERGGEDPDGHACRVEGRPQTRSATSVAARRTVAAESSRSAVSEGATIDLPRERLAGAVGEDEAARRRRRPRAAAVRTGVERRRWASERSVAQAAARTASSRSVPVWATNAVSAGNAPHESANPRSVCTLPPRSSRL